MLNHSVYKCVFLFRDHASWRIRFARWRRLLRTITRVCISSILYFIITTTFRFRVSDPCLVHYCGRGEECAALGGVARCICVRKCGPAKRRVCGTDGRLYDNRCELHKSGCLSGVDIQIDHSLKCFIPSGESVLSVYYCEAVCYLPSHLQYNIALQVPYILRYILYI